MIYLIADVEKRWCKIGYSKDPVQRLKTIQTSIPIDIEILCIVEGDMKKEERLHTKFRRYALRGEWFSYTTEILEYIEKLPPPKRASIKNRTYKRKSVDELAEEVYSYIEQRSTDYMYKINHNTVYEIVDNISSDISSITKAINKLKAEYKLVKMTWNKDITGTYMLWRKNRQENPDV